VTTRARFALLCALAAPIGKLAAQDASIFSIGQPSRWQNYADLLVQRSSNAPTSALLVAGSEQSIFSPVVGALSVDGELYGIGGSRRIEGGARTIARSPAIALGVGLDWNVTRGRADALITYKSAILRGGLLGRGTMLRVDYMPTRGQSLAVGVSAPLHQPLAGRTRPRHTDVELPAATRHSISALALPMELEGAVASLEQNVNAIRACANIWSAESVRYVKTVVSCPATSAAYYQSLKVAFSLALLGDGLRVEAHARGGLLDNVLLPFDTLLGRVKEPGNRIDGLTSNAQERFARWIADSSGVPAERQGYALAIHARWLRSIERAHAALFAQWKDSRFIWLPLQLALTPDQYDEQSEIDALIGRAVGHPFTGDNALMYLEGRDLPLAIARSIFAARDYHVLWTHDITSKRHTTHNLDNVGYELIADVYLPALTAAVRRYDDVGHLPAFMIFLDQYFYEPRGGRLWMTILEDPLHASMNLPGNNADREQHLRARQHDLQAAVAASARLQADAAQNGGDAWLRRTVKVHVNITDPSDFSFRSNRIAPPWPMAPDNLMRDHRKIAFYDLDEADPWRGSLLMMGTGVGEQFASATWEDRGVRMRGPATLEARAGLRQVLLANGFSASDIPPQLRERIPIRIAERRANADVTVGRALQVQNEVGWGAKGSSVARAMLYDLVQPGSVIVVPDPQWLSPHWASMLAGASARGAKVYVIAPALANAPVDEPALQTLAREVLGHLLDVRTELPASLQASGGALDIGVFTATAPATDIPGRLEEIRAGVARAPWMKELFPFGGRDLALLEASDARAAANGTNATQLARDEIPREPKVHQKTQLVARPGSIQALLRQRGWAAAVAGALDAQADETSAITAQLDSPSPMIDTVSSRRPETIMGDFERRMRDADRRALGLYFTVGTQNQDPRGMALDGEATVVTSGFQAAAGVVDLYYLMARSTWIESKQALERLIPVKSSLMTRIARWIWPTM
jgi:hypothetical protein